MIDLEAIEARMVDPWNDNDDWDPCADIHALIARVRELEKVCVGRAFYTNRMGHGADGWIYFAMGLFIGCISGGAYQWWRMR